MLWYISTYNKRNIFGVGYDSIFPYTNRNEGLLPMKQPNILFIMTDQMRGDCMGAVGHPDVKTPYLDSLAAKGILFDNAYSSCPSCVPARAALYTGLAQENHGKVGYQDASNWNYPHTIAGELSKAGYHTHCAGKLHVHPLRNLMGFHSVDLHDGYLHAYRNPSVPYCESQKIADDYFYWLKNEKGIDADVTDTGAECNGWVARPWIYEEKYHPTNWVTDRCLDFLRKRDREKPFFLMASYLRPHPPFDAPACYFEMYRNKELTPPPIGDWEPMEDFERQGRIYDSATGPCDPELIREAQIGYYACITHMDHQIGRLIQSLIEEGVMENTLIVFTSDHGEELCDHRLFRKYRPYEGSARVPMILSGGLSITKTKPGSVCHSLVELRDVLPTLLDAANLPIPEAVDGESMMPLAQDTTKQIRTWLHGEHELGVLSNHFIVTSTDKYAWYSQTGEEQYFDLEQDPKELHNGIADDKYQDRIAYLRNCLIQTLSSREEGFVKDGQLVVGCNQYPILKESIFTRGYKKQPNL